MADEKQNTSAPVTDEIATVGKDIDVFFGWIKRMENPDPTLRTESKGKGLKLYDEVDRDAHAGSVLQTRYLAVTGKEWEVLPPDESAKAKEIADFVKSTLLASNFDQARQELLQAILYGHYEAEVIWAVRDGKIVPQKIRGKHPKRFVFDLDRSLRLLTPANMIDGEEVPERKFIVFTYGSSDNPYGKGLGQKLWWPVWFKKHGIKFWLVYLEKFGMPTAVGKYPPGTPPDEQNKLLEAIDALQSESGVKIPDTMLIELLEATRSGKVTHESICEYMDRQISKAVLGQTASTEGTPGKLGNEDAQSEVREDILKADANLLCECLNETLVHWLVDFNFAGVTDYPKIWIRTEAEQDLKELAERDKTLVNEIGLPVAKRYFYETYAIPEPEKGEELVTPQTVKPEAKEPEAGGKEFAEGVDNDLSPATTLNLLGERALEQAGVDDLMAPVEKLLAKVESLEEFRDLLLDLYKDMDESALGNLMQKAMTVADLAGRFDVES